MKKLEECIKEIIIEAASFKVGDTVKLNKKTVEPGSKLAKYPGLAAIGKIVKIKKPDRGDLGIDSAYAWYNVEFSEPSSFDKGAKFKLGREWILGKFLIKTNS